jgi:predicted regulator of Ras-like GTPase activity (Roadblock/LC7/MglB family)
LRAVEAAQALADLTEISAQIEVAVLASDDGSLVGSTFSNEATGERFAREAAELLRSANDAAEGDVAQELVQLQAATPQGCVFVVRDGSHFVAAITGPQPTVGLVFYDLKTCLRLVERDETEAKKPTRRKPATKADGSS